MIDLKASLMVLPTMWRQAVIVVCAALVLASCKSDTLTEFEDIPVFPPDVLYNQGLALSNAKSYKQAAKKFDQLDKQHPYSSYARKSLLLAANAYHKIGAYSEAVTAGRRYYALFPQSDDAPYALYLIAESYYRQIQDVTRDQQETDKAVKVYKELLREFPDSEYAADAERKIAVGTGQLAGKEMQVGRYYLERENYIAAVNRFRVVVTDHQQTPHVEEALMRIAEAYLALGVVQEAQTAVAVLGHNFPESAWYQRAYTLLNNGGLTPNDNPDSWISRLFQNKRT
jgi:outer membrane protein assembly factor BamD